jgi:hypothetical protein
VVKFARAAEIVKKITFEKPIDFSKKESIIIIVKGRKKTTSLRHIT